MFSSVLSTPDRVRVVGIGRSDPRLIQIGILLAFTLLGLTVLLFVLLNLGFFISYRVNRAHLVAAFWLSYAIGEALVLLAERASLWLWWPAISSGAVLLFAFFMITDPRTSPNSMVGRILYGTLTSLIFVPLALLRAPVPLFTALAIACCFVPMINRRFGGVDQTWQRLNDVTNRLSPNYVRTSARCE